MRKPYKNRDKKKIGISAIIEIIVLFFLKIYRIIESFPTEHQTSKTMIQQIRRGKRAAKF